MIFKFNIGHKIYENIFYVYVDQSHKMIHFGALKCSLANTKDDTLRHRKKCESSIIPATQENYHKRDENLVPNTSKPT